MHGTRDLAFGDFARFTHIDEGHIIIADLFPGVLDPDGVDGCVIRLIATTDSI